MSLKPFGYQHLPDNICILTEGSCPRCDLCDMQDNCVSEAQWRRHYSSGEYRKGNKRKRQRKAYRRNALSLDVKFTAYGQELERVEFFKYLGRILTYDDKDIQDVLGNLNKARAVWRRILHVLRSENMSPKVCKKDMQIPNEGFMFEHRYIFSSYEKAVTNVFHDVLGRKSAENIAEGIVLDIGGNTGWFANLAAFCYGSRVHIFEPQPDCFNVICPLFRINSVENLITTHNNFVSNQKDMTLTLNKNAGCDPGFSPPKRSVDGGLISIPPINPADWSLDEENIPIILVKIDVEGNEVDVLNALSPLIASKRINDVVMEVNPKHYGKNDEYDKNLSVYDRCFFSQGFQAFHLEGKKSYSEFADFKGMMGGPATQRLGGNVHFSRK